MLYVYKQIKSTYHEETKDLHSQHTPYGYTISFSIPRHFNYRRHAHINSYRQRHIQNRHKAQESEIITLSNAGTQPDTVMVEPPNTAITDIAVDCPRRPENMARVAKFDGLGEDGLHIEATLRDHQVIVLLLRLFELIIEVKVWCKSTFFFSRSLVHSWNHSCIRHDSFYQCVIRDYKADKQYAEWNQLEFLLLKV